MSIEIPRPDATYNQNKMMQIFEIIDQRLRLLEQPAKTGYIVTNLVRQKTLDGTAGTAADVRNVLATLITDIKAKGGLA